MSMGGKILAKTGKALVRGQPKLTTAQRFGLLSAGLGDIASGGRTHRMAEQAAGYRARDAALVAAKQGRATPSTAPPGAYGGELERKQLALRRRPSVKS